MHGTTSHIFWRRAACADQREATVVVAEITATEQRSYPLHLWQCHFCDWQNAPGTSSTRRCCRMPEGVRPDRNQIVVGRAPTGSMRRQRTRQRKSEARRRSRAGFCQPAVPLRCPVARLCRIFAIPGWRRSYESVEQFSRRLRDLVNRALESELVRSRRLSKATQFSNKLKCRCSDFVISSWWLEIV